MPKPVLAKHNKKLKFPSQSRSVKSAMERAVAKSKEQKWNKVIVIGLGKDHGHYFHSYMNEAYVLSMLEDVKYLIIKERLDGGRIN